MSLVDPRALPDGPIGVAVSGGVDSMCLLHCLSDLGVDIVAVTLDHGIRGQDGADDCALVQRYARSLGVAVRYRYVDVPAYCATHKVGLEQGARQVRYAFFDDLLAEGAVSCIATAHHRDDLAESVLLNIMRGTGLRGLGGMGNRPGYIRPLLGVTRAQIEDYARANNVPYRQDATNNDTTYRRNFVRHKVLPLLQQEFADAPAKLADLSAVAIELAQAMDAVCIAPVQQGGVVFLPLGALSQPKAMAKWSIGLAIRHFNHGVDFGEAHYNIILGLADAANNTTVDLPWGVSAAREYDRIAFWRGVPDAVTYPFAEGRFVFGDATYTVRPYRQGDRLRFDADAIPTGAVLRLRRAGDVIAKFGGGTKSLGDYYTDNKVPLRLRNATPVVAVDNQVLVCMHDIAATVAVGANTTRIFTLSEEE